jgi:predicted Zn-dependent protease
LKLGVIGVLVQIPLSVWEAGYNKAEELEADREGMRVAVLGGYSPYGAVTLFEKFAKLHKEYIIHAQSPEEELSQLAIQSLEGYFRSHPQPSERLTQANAVIAHEGWQDRKVQKPFRVEYETHNGQYVK